MKQYRIIWFFPVMAVVLTLIWNHLAVAAEISGKASTVLEWHDDIGGETSIPMYQYLLFNVLDINGQRLNFKGYGRLGMDTRDVIDADSRLFYAFLEKRGSFHNKLDFRLGRQFVSTTAGASILDGLSLHFTNLGPLGFKVFGGGNATYYENYDLDDLIFGAELYGRFFKELDLALSYVQTREDSDLSKELLGLDFLFNIDELAELYSEVQFDNLRNRFSYILGGAKFYKSPRWDMRIEYLYSLPVFSSTSIYSVFAVDEYEELSGEFTYRITTGLRTFARYSRELYREYDDADVFEAGIEKIRTDRFSGYLAGVVRSSGDGEDMKGVKARGAYQFNKFFQAGIGANVDVFDRRIDLQEGTDEITSERYWLFGTFFINDDISIQAKMERLSSDEYDEYYQARVRLTIRF